MGSRQRCLVRLTPTDPTFQFLNLNRLIAVSVFQKNIRFGRPNVGNGFLIVVVASNRTNNFEKIAKPTNLQPNIGLVFVTIFKIF